MTSPTPNLGVPDKSVWRSTILAARAAVPPDVRAAEAAALGAHLAGSSGLICAYRPVGTEPGGADLPDLLAAGGATVLLPVVDTAAGALDWAAFRPGEELLPGRYGIPEPPGPRLGPGAVADADLVLVPALAVDRLGNRLGRGAGWYDRTLGLARPGVTTAVVRDEEFVAAIPSEPHDVPVFAVLTPGRGIFRLAT